MSVTPARKNETKNISLDVISELLDSASWEEVILSITLDAMETVPTEVQAKAVEVFKDKTKAAYWLLQPQLSLGGNSPINIINENKRCPRSSWTNRTWYLWVTSIAIVFRLSTQGVVQEDYGSKFIVCDLIGVRQITGSGDLQYLMLDLVGILTVKTIQNNLQDAFL